MTYQMFTNFVYKIIITGSRVFLHRVRKHFKFNRCTQSIHEKVTNFILRQIDTQINKIEESLK